MEFMDNSTSPYHAVKEASEILDTAGFNRIYEDHDWDLSAGAFYVIRDGSMISWIVSDATSLGNGFAIVAAHTDSPNLRLKPVLTGEKFGLKQFGLETYGSPLLNTWLDRDLGISGRLIISKNDSLIETLVQINDPICRIPQLAIHLDRTVNDEGLILNPQNHLRPIWNDLGSVMETFKDFLASQISEPATSLKSWDLMLHDVQSATRIGAENQWLSSGRIDNLVSCHSAITAIKDLTEQKVQNRIPMVCLFNHEEVGSTSATGAASNFLPSVVERLTSQHKTSDKYRALSKSTLLSADGAHATHPNYPEKHDIEHQISLNGGIVIKRNNNERYATTATGQAFVQTLCDSNGLPYQLFSNRSDMNCGSTIGPVTSALLGIETIDIGIAQLSMHSSRELCGVEDAELLTLFMKLYLKSGLFSNL